VAVIAGLASASSFTLRVAKNVHVTNDPTQAFRVKAVNTHEAVAVGPAGFALYTFQGETTHHLICKSKGANGCLGFWPPLTVKSSKGLSKAPAIKGKLGTFKRKGIGLQVTLNGQPLYYFTPDLTGGNKRQATGDELKTFGSIWHIVKAGSGTQAGQTSPQPTMPTTGTTTGTTPTYPTGTTPTYPTGTTPTYP
jgi:predicted lipoprotein with Yx(FWY)xxD motif